MYSSDNKTHPVDCICYTTWDGIIMLEGDIMWRVCNSKIQFFEKPEKVVFHHRTGYNMLPLNPELMEQKIKFDLMKSPFDKNHIHFFDKKYAKEFLKNLNKILPSPKLINHYINFYKKDKFWCPCQLGVPFYPDKNCQCGG